MKNKEEKNNLTVLVFGFLGMVGLGVGAMLVAGLLETREYEQELSNAVESFKQIERQDAGE